MVDLVLATAPYTESKFPLAAIGVLKSIAHDAGWSCVALDLNIQTYNEILVSENQNQLVDWFYSEKYYPEIEDQLDDMFTRMAKQILEYKPKLVGLSLFTYACQIGAKYLCIKIKQLDPAVKVIIGGSGIYDSVNSDSQYIDGMIAMNLIDHYITGDADVSFGDFLKGERAATGIDNNEWLELDNEVLASLPYPDYDDYDWSKYEVPGIPITGSRGCVRRCTFCNDIVHWKRFSYRSGQNIFDEMMHQKNRYGINLFVFTDALINGNVREFKNLIKLMADHNLANPDDKLSWDSQFIFRPKNQFSESDWDLVAASNPYRIHVGIESISEAVRFDMGKKFDQNSMEFNLEQALKHDIKIIGMLIVGYPTESRADIDYAKHWLEENIRFNKILQLTWGGTMSILPGTYLDENREKYGLNVYGPPWQHWTSTITGSTPRLRAEWLTELKEHSDSLGFKISKGIENESIVATLMSYEHQKALEPWINQRSVDYIKYHEL